MFGRLPYAVLVFLFLAKSGFPQMIQIDRGVHAASLMCFPLLTDSTKFQYLPQNAHLALDPHKLPQFSFVRFVKNVATAQALNKSITDAKGGGVLHFLVTYDTPESEIEKAQDALREITRIPNAELQGPVIFKEGRYSLVSSILLNGTKDQVKQVITTGQAPVLEGGRIALSFELDPEKSKILLESFKMSTPDISVLFEMTFSGLTDAYNATMTVNWADVYRSETTHKSSSALFFSEEIEKSYRELQRNNSIKLETAGSDERMEALVDNAYQRITSMLFDPVNPEALFGNEQQQANENLNNQFSVLDLFNARKLLNLNSSKGYRLKESKNSGTSVLTFNSRLSMDRYHTMVFNMGDLFKKYGNDPRFFRTINLDDPDFQQREILVGIDGEVLPEFDKLINSVTVTLRKTHETGEVTIQEINLTKAIVNGNEIPELVYGSVGDKDREKWLDYDYKATFQMKGGKTFETAWIKQASAMINLYPPYIRRIIQLDGNMDELRKKGVRAISVDLEYDFLNEPQHARLSIRTGESLEGKQLEITMPKSQLDYNYKLTWYLEDGQQKTMSGKSSGGFLFLDTI